jgi:putative transposase
MLSYKYRIYPTVEQEQKLNRTMGICRYAYNKLLEQRNNGMGKRETQAYLVTLKSESPFVAEVHSKVLQMVNNQLWYSIKAMASLKKNGRKVGKLRFKGKNTVKTLNYNQCGFKFEDDGLWVSRIGKLKIKLHRPIDGPVKGVIVKKQCDRWYAIAQVESPHKTLPKTGKSIGLDVGITSFATDSDGNTFGNPKNLARGLEQLKTLQKDLSRKRNGSKNRQKAKSRIAKKFESITNKRDDFLHKLSHHYIANYDTIIVEDLDIKGLVQKGDKHQATLRRNIHDASWGKFMDMLTYKAERAGRHIIKVEARGTTQKCSKCGSVVKKRLWNRVHRCEACGLVVDRDYNSAVNILNAGAGRSEEPLEDLPLRKVPSISVILGQASPMKKEAPCYS